MDPVTMAFIASALVGGVIKANASRRAAQAQAAQDERNARVQEMAAGDALLRGQAQESAVNQLTSERISTGRAQLGASGVDVQSGSAIDTLAGQRARGALAALVVRTNAAREAWGYSTEAQGLHARAAYALQSGDDAMLGQLLGTGASILGGMSNLRGGGGGGGTPGIDAPIIRVGEPTYPAPDPGGFYGP